MGLAALFSMASLALVCVYLAVEALTRMYDFFVLGTMEDVDGKFMSIIAAIGVLVNIALAIVLGGAHPELPGGGHDHASAQHAGEATPLTVSSGGGSAAGPAATKKKE